MPVINVTGPLTTTTFSGPLEDALGDLLASSEHSYILTKSFAGGAFRAIPISSQQALPDSSAPVAMQIWAARTSQVGGLSDGEILVDSEGRKYRVQDVYPGPKITRISTFYIR